MSSWGHAIEKLTEDNTPSWLRKCKGGRRCESPPTHAVSYFYVTGRAGRTSQAVRHYCDDHARSFVLKHKIEAPDTDARLLKEEVK